MPGLILIEIAFGLPFCILLFRAFVAAIPRELDEAAIARRRRPLRLFFRVILPLLRPVIVTVIVVQSVSSSTTSSTRCTSCPATENATVQLTLTTSRART